MEGKAPSFCVYTPAAASAPRPPLRAGAPRPGLGASGVAFLTLIAVFVVGVGAAALRYVAPGFEPHASAAPAPQEPPALPESAPPLPEPAAAPPPPAETAVAESAPAPPPKTRAPSRRPSASLRDIPRAPVRPARAPQLPDNPYGS